MAKKKDVRIRIRMYRVGFGDCFLLSLGSGGTARHVLLDCGVHSGKGDIKTMAKVIADVNTETGGQIAVVVATHRHQDHISGFARDLQTWSTTKVGEVWMPWTEDPSDAKAKTLRAKHAALAERLRLQFRAVGGAPQGVEDILENATGMAAAAKGGSNEAALATLRSGFDGKPTVRYLKAGDELERPAGIAGLSVRVLGPPTDENYLKQMDPPKSDRYVAGLDGDDDAAAGGRPFSKKCVAARNRFPKGFAGLSKEDEKALVGSAASPLSELAFALDQAINNTSLVLMLTYFGSTLLLPGDAQYGNWRFWLEDAGSDALLKTVVFYKVSHHGSINATPKQVVDALPKGKFAAMVSTQSEPWPSIPRMPLLKKLTAASRGLVRSDCISVSGAPAAVKMSRPPSGFTRGAFWVDYEVP